MKVHISHYPDERELAYKVFRALKQLLPGARTKYTESESGMQHIYFKLNTQKQERG